MRALILLSMAATTFAWAAEPRSMPPRRPIEELVPVATLRLGKTADWVVITADAVWVGSTGPNAVHRIDPRSNRLVATVSVPGEPCAGLAAGFGSLWVPLCSHRLAKVSLSSNRLTAVFPVGPAAKESGITTGAGSVWMVTDAQGSLARIDPHTGVIRQTISVPAGSYNPLFSGGTLWLTRAEGAEITSIDAATGSVLGTTATGPKPRFLTAGDGSIWTLNQGDGSLTRIDAGSRRALKTVALATPGHGGDIGFGAGMVWTTIAHVPLSGISSATNMLRCQWEGPGGDSLRVADDAIWLTDYYGGTVSRLKLQDVLAHCAVPVRTSRPITSQRLAHAVNRAPAVADHRYVGGVDGESLGATRCDQSLVRCRQQHTLAPERHEIAAETHGIIVGHLEDADPL
jgi:virginiamycin B lyase